MFFGGGFPFGFGQHPGILHNMQVTKKMKRIKNNHSTIF